MATSGLWLAAGMLLISGCAGPLDPTVSVEVGGPTRSDLGADRAGLTPSSGDESTGSGGLFYPLDLGNHWAYDRTFSFQILPDGGPPGPLEVFGSTVEADLIETEERFGREYIVQLETYREDERTFSFRFLYRQDQGGLYNADPEPTAGAGLVAGYESADHLATIPSVAHALSDGPDAARQAYRQALHRVLEKHAMVRDLALHGRMFVEGDARSTRPGPLEGEIALLRYPLHSQQTWHVREDPLVVFNVEGQEALELPAGVFNGWRIRIDWPDFFGPNDRAHVWYGRSGFLKLLAHFEGIATDDSGNPYGRIVSDEVEVLSAVSVLDRRSPDLGSW